jgi:hypothetical protein
MVLFSVSQRQQSALFSHLRFGAKTSELRNPGAREADLRGAAGVRVGWRILPFEDLNLKLFHR